MKNGGWAQERSVDPVIARDRLIGKSRSFTAETRRRKEIAVIADIARHRRDRKSTEDTEAHGGLWLGCETSAAAKDYNL